MLCTKIMTTTDHKMHNLRTLLENQSTFRYDHGKQRVIIRYQTAAENWSFHFFALL